MKQRIAESLQQKHHLSRANLQINSNKRDAKSSISHGFQLSNEGLGFRFWSPYKWTSAAPCRHFCATRTFQCWCLVPVGVLCVDFEGVHGHKGSFRWFSRDDSGSGNNYSSVTTFNQNPQQVAGVHHSSLWVGTDTCRSSFRRLVGGICGTWKAAASVETKNPEKEQVDKGYISPAIYR